MPSSRKLAETASDTCRRRRLNARGVDVNRNWNASWSDGDDASSSDQFRGPQPFSEPETRSLASLAAAWRPDIYVDVHSGETYLATPFASKLQAPHNATHKGALRGVVAAVTRMMQSRHADALPPGGLPNGPASSLGEEPYRASGTSLDYMYSQLGIARSFMFSVYGSSSFVSSDHQRPVIRPPSMVMLADTDAVAADAAEATAAAGAGAAAAVAAGRPAAPQPARGQPLRLLRSRRPALDYFGVWSNRTTVMSNNDTLALFETAPSATEQLAPSAADAAAARAADAAAASAGRGLRRVAASATSLLAAGRPLAPQEESNFDCVGYFNPVSQPEYERTVDAWADAFLTVVNQSTLTLEEAARQ